MPTGLVEAVDVEVDDLILVRGKGQSEGTCVEPYASLDRRASSSQRQPRQGLAACTVATRGLLSSVFRDGNYVGRALYRHWDESEDE